MVGGSRPNMRFSASASFSSTIFFVDVKVLKAKVQVFIDYKEGWPSDRLLDPGPGTVAPRRPG